MKKTLLALALTTSGLLAVPTVFAQDQSAQDPATQNQSTQDQSAQDQSTQDQSTTSPQSSVSTLDSQQKGHTGAYLDLGLGAGRINRGPYNHNNYAGALTFGYRWAVSPDLSVGPEIGYAYLGKQKARDSYKRSYYANYPYGGTRDPRSNLRGATLGGAMRVNLTPEFYLNVRVGAFEASGSGLSGSRSNTVSRSFQNNLGYYAGAGVGWDINQNWGLGLNYNHYEVRLDSTAKINGNPNGTRARLDTDTLTANVEYRF